MKPVVVSGVPGKEDVTAALERDRRTVAGDAVGRRGGASRRLQRLPAARVQSQRGQQVASGIELEPQAVRADLDIPALLESGQASLRDEKPGHLGGVRDLNDAQILDVVRPNGGQRR